MPHKIRDDSGKKPLFYFGNDLIIKASQTKIESSENLLTYLDNQINWISFPELNSKNYDALPQGNFYILKLKIQNNFQDSQQT